MPERVLQPILADLAHALLGFPDDVCLPAESGLHDFRPVRNRENRARQKGAR